MKESSGYWLHYSSCERVFPRNRLIAALEKTGIMLETWQTGVPGRGGIFLFDTFDSDMEKSLEECCRENPQRVIAVFLGERGVPSETAFRILALGVGDILGWSGMESLVMALSSRLGRWQQVDSVVASVTAQGKTIGTSRAWKETVRQVVEAALFSKSPILLTGETGTGKEMLANLIHSLDRRPIKGSLTILDCSTVVPGLSGSEFFGHERGAFTHAVTSREGAFAIADGGTLFLDEIGELPMGVQSELLRGIQEQTFKKVGGQAWLQSDFRLVAATNRSLSQEIEKGSFRQDLYHRLAGWVIQLPPLRERREDVLPLAELFARESLGPGAKVKFEDCVQEFLLTRDYPGNIRELRHLVHLMAARSGGQGPITIGDVPLHAASFMDSKACQRRAGSGFEMAVRLAFLRGMTLKEISREATVMAMEIALEVEGNLQAAAERLGVCKRTLELRRASERRQSKDASPAEPAHAEEMLSDSQPV